MTTCQLGRLKLFFNTKPCCWSDEWLMSLEISISFQDTRVDSHVLVLPVLCNTLN